MRPDPPHPSARQRTRRPAAAPDLVVVDGPAEHYLDNVHDVLKLVLVPDAPFEVRRRGRRFEAGPGRLVALHEDEAHSGGPADDEGAPRWALLCLPRQRLEWPGGDLRFPEPALPDPLLAQRFSRLQLMLRSAGPRQALRADEAVLGLVRRLARYGVRAADDPAAARPAAVARARDHLGDRLDRNVTLDELARAAGTSTFALVRGFTRHYGLPPHAMQLRLRLDRAQDLLARGERPADVALRTGFADQAHLTRAFGRLYGVTPAVWRQLHQQLI